MSPTRSELAQPAHAKNGNLAASTSHDGGPHRHRGDAGNRDAGVPRPALGQSIASRARTVVTRVIDIPVRSAATTGRGVLMSIAVLYYSVIDTVSLRLPFGECVVQAWTLLKVTAVPALLMAVPFGAIVSVQTSGLVNQVGASSLIGAASGVGVIRQGAPITAGLLMGGAAASALASDLGSRAIREELDALRVLGVDPVRTLVVPRFWALIVVAPILCCIIIAAAVAASFTFAITVGEVTSGSFWTSFGTFAKMVDVWFTFGKAILFAAIVVIISCLRGMEARGGPRGVADAVNSSVVLNVICIALVNLAITQLQTMFFPMEVS